ncbi:hypothetical protein CIB48_g8651 [Xylaria polymorpha]|nr:hypothetical protein CIB48_g8651 [Xylaria polymorpha]
MMAIIIGPKAQQIRARLGGCPLQLNNENTASDEVWWFDYLQERDVNHPTSLPAAQHEAKRGPDYAVQYLIQIANVPTLLPT